MKPLPAGIQSFADLRSSGYLYVDKTEDIYRMITTGKPYFLSRPRRFGKSLLISAMQAVFEGKRELFEGLYIYDKIDWARKHPVIRLDMSERGHRSAKELESSLHSFIEEKAEEYNISFIEKSLPGRFGELIRNIHRQTGQQVVVLIDEYDKPIIDNLKNIELACANRTVLHDMY